MQTFKIYHGDFRQILNGLAGKAVITDPPYGVGLDYGGFVDSVEYVQSIIPPLIEMSNRIADVLLFPSGQYEIEKWIFQNYPPRWRICWYKGAQSTASVIGFSDWEMIFVYGNNIYNFAHDYFFAKTAPADNGHPCPKSVAWARWLVEKFTNPGDTVIDPFMGSGTTGVACMELGRKFIGIDQSEKFCKIAENRIKNAQPALFTTMRQPNTRLQPTDYGAGGQSKIPLQGSLFADESSAKNGGG